MDIAISICKNPIIMPEIHEGDVVRKLREERTWSRDKLADESGLRPNTIGDLEKFGARNLRTLRSVARAFGIELEDIFCKLKELRHSGKTIAAFRSYPKENEGYHEILEELLASNQARAIIEYLDFLKFKAISDKEQSRG
jgi:transcriptional regulator with XRE-family HTH domain